MSTSGRATRVESGGWIRFKNTRTRDSIARSNGGSAISCSNSRTRCWSAGMKRSSDHSMDGLLESPEPYSGPLAVRARVSRGRLIVDVDDGRTIAVPLAHFTGFAELPPRAFKNLELM